MRRKTERRARAFLAKMRRTETGEVVLGSSQVEATALLRAMPIPPAPAGAPDMGERDLVDPVAYRRERNRKKRERRAGKR